MQTKFILFFILATLFQYSFSMDEHQSKLIAHLSTILSIHLEPRQFLNNLPHKQFYTAMDDLRTVSTSTKIVIFNKASADQQFFLRILSLPKEQTEIILDCYFDNQQNKEIFYSMPLAQGLIKYAYAKEKYDKDSKLRNIIKLDQLYALPTNSIIELYNAIAHFQQHKNNTRNNPYIINRKQNNALFLLPDKIKNSTYFLLDKNFKIQKKWNPNLSHCLRDVLYCIATTQLNLILSKFIVYCGVTKSHPLQLLLSIVHTNLITALLAKHYIKHYFSHIIHIPHINFRPTISFNSFIFLYATPMSLIMYPIFHNSIKESSELSLMPKPLSLAILMFCLGFIDKAFHYCDQKEITPVHLDKLQLD